MATSTGQMTVEQYLALPEQCDTNGNDVKSELIAGEIFLAPLPSLRHDLLKNQICDVLRSFLGERPDSGLRAFVQMGFAVTEVDALIPDVCVIAKSRLQETTSKVLTGAPEIAIEVLSPSDTVFHFRRKIDTYLSNGSRTVWAVYSEERSIQVYTKDGARELKGEQVIEDKTLPGFSHPVSSFF